MGNELLLKNVSRISSNALKRQIKGYVIDATQRDKRVDWKKRSVYHSCAIFQTRDL